MNCSSGGGGGRSERVSNFGCMGSDITVTKNTDSAGKKRKAEEVDPLGSDSPGIVWHQAKKKAGQADSVEGENSGCMGSGSTITNSCVGTDITNVLADRDDPLGSDNLDSDWYMAKKKADQVDQVKNTFPVQETPHIELETRASENISVINANLNSKGCLIKNV